MLCTHLGLSGPAVLDISRYWIDAQLEDAQTTLFINWWPGKTTETMDKELQTLGHTSLLKYLHRQLPERLARALCGQAGLEAALPGYQLTRAQRKTLAGLVTEMPLPITGNRGWNVAEVTAGGVPLSELNLRTMESRSCPGLYLCGELCDVDGRIGGYNFQWAWASGYVAGVSVGSS
jgi:predicted Rossmann fold flavoprotein